MDDGDLEVSEDDEVDELEPAEEEVDGSLEASLDREAGRFNLSG